MSLPATPEGDKTPTPMTDQAQRLLAHVSQDYRMGRINAEQADDEMYKALEPVRSLERRISALEGEAVELRKDKARLDFRSNCTVFQANEILRFCGERCMQFSGDHVLYRAAIDHVMATVPGAFGDRSAMPSSTPPPQ
jgi:hypothetical protein